MPRFRTILATAGTAVLLVLAGAHAGAQLSDAGAVAAVAPGATAAPAQGTDDSPPDRDDRTDDATADIGVNAITPVPEMVYVPITPCRVANTSKVTPLGSGTSRNFYVAGTFGFTPQGGTSGGCGVPEGARAAVVTILALDPSKAGRLKAWPAGSSEPTAATLYYGSSTTSTGQTVTLRSGAGTDLTIRNFTATTDVVIDVTGYYVLQMTAYVSSAGTMIDQSGRATAVTRTAVGSYQVTWDRPVGDCAVVGSSDDSSGHIVTAWNSGSTTYAYTNNDAGTLEDYWFYLAVHC